MARMTLKENWKQTKEELMAYFRQGLHELGSVFYGHGTAAQHAEYGMLGTKTPGQVADAYKPEKGMQKEGDRSANEPGLSSLDARVRQAELRESPAPEAVREERELEPG